MRIFEDNATEVGEKTVSFRGEGMGKISSLGRLRQDSESYTLGHAGC